MLLSKRQAEEIVRIMSRFLPHNINIMNADGVILASCTPERVGQTHAGALAAIKDNTAIHVTDAINNMRPGVNLPISYDGQLVGVVGISGNVEEIDKFAYLIKATTEMLMHQENIISMQQSHQSMVTRYLTELSMTSAPYNENFIRRGHELDLDITPIRRALLFSASDEKVLDNIVSRLARTIQKGDLSVRLTQIQYILLLTEDRDVTAVLEAINPLPADFKVGMGRLTNNYSLSIKEATQAITIGSVLDEKYAFYDYEKYLLANIFLKNRDDHHGVELIKRLVKDGNRSELVETMVEYIAQSGELQSTADKLHIHRNSLSYRIERIKELTGRDLHKTIDAMYLYGAYVVYSLPNVLPI